MIAGRARRAREATAGARARRAGVRPSTAAVALERLTSTTADAVHERRRRAGLTLAHPEASRREAPAAGRRAGPAARAAALARHGLHRPRFALAHAGACAHRAPGAAVEARLDPNPAERARRLATLARRAFACVARPRDAARACCAGRRPGATRLSSRTAAGAGARRAGEPDVAAIARAARVSRAPARAADPGAAHEDPGAGRGAGAARGVERAATTIVGRARVEAPHVEAPDVEAGRIDACGVEARSIELGIRHTRLERIDAGVRSVGVGCAAALRAAPGRDRQQREPPRRACGSARSRDEARRIRHWVAC